LVRVPTFLQWEISQLSMNRKLTVITPEINGYCVVAVQEETKDGRPGAFLGCLLQTSGSAENGPLLLLGEAIRKYKVLAAKSAPKKQDALIAE
jgi:hypothetical protein